MKRRIKRMAGMAVFLLCTVLGLGQMRTFLGMGSGLSYQSRTEIPLETAEEIREDAGTDEDVPDLTFWRQERNQTISADIPVKRESTVCVITICGDPKLLTGNFQVPAAGDTKGCLLDRDTAWKLFGNTNVIGAAVKYKEREYVIKGILEGVKATLIVQASKDEKAGFNRIAAGDYGEPESWEIKERLQNRYQLEVTEMKWGFMGFSSEYIPAKWSDLGFYGSLWNTWAESAQEFLQTGLGVFEIKRLWSCLALGCCIFAGGWSISFIIKNFSAKN